MFEEQKKKVEKFAITLIASGMPVRKVADTVGVTSNTVMNYIRRASRRGELIRNPLVRNGKSWRMNPQQTDENLSEGQ
jgi:transposase